MCEYTFVYLKHFLWVSTHIAEPHPHRYRPAEFIGLCSYQKEEPKISREAVVVVLMVFEKAVQKGDPITEVMIARNDSTILCFWPTHS